MSEASNSNEAVADVAVIGGTGFYSFLGAGDDAVEGGLEQHDVETPYGAPSAPISVGTVAGRRVAFLPRHGSGHEFPPHRINYRANLWALRSLGVRQVLAPCAVGGLRDEVAPGDVVVPDQLVDRTTGRPQTYVETGAVHLPFADPYCAQLGAAVAEADDTVKTGGAMVVIEGPRFSTRAESQHYASQGWTLVNMTGHPEAVLARELRMCYSAIALVTDMDAGVETGSGVGQEEVFALFAANLERLTGLLTSVVGSLPDPDGCSCASWAAGITLTYQIPGSTGEGAAHRVGRLHRLGDRDGARRGRPRGRPDRPDAADGARRGDRPGRHRAARRPRRRPLDRPAPRRRRGLPPGRRGRCRGDGERPARLRRAQRLRHRGAARRDARRGGAAVGAGLLDGRLRRGPLRLR